MSFHVLKVVLNLDIMDPTAPLRVLMSTVVTVTYRREPVKAVNLGSEVIAVNWVCCLSVIRIYTLVNWWMQYFFINVSYIDSVVSLFVWVFSPLQNVSFIWRRHNDRWRAAHVDLCSALIAIEHWGSLAYNIYCVLGHPLKMVISEDLWQSHLLPDIRQWSCYYLFLRLMSVVERIRTHNLPLVSWTPWPTTPTLRLHT